MSSSNDTPEKSLKRLNSLQIQKNLIEKRLGAISVNFDSRKTRKFHLDTRTIDALETRLNEISLEIDSEKKNLTKVKKVTSNSNMGLVGRDYKESNQTIPTSTSETSNIVTATTVDSTLNTVSNPSSISFSETTEKTTVSRPTSLFIPYSTDSTVDFTNTPVTPPPGFPLKIDFSKNSLIDNNTKDNKLDEAKSLNDNFELPKGTETQKERDTRLRMEKN